VGYVIVTSVYVFSGETPNTHLAKRARDLASLRSIAKRSIAVSVQACRTSEILSKYPIKASWSYRARVTGETPGRLTDGNSPPFTLRVL